MHINSLRAEIKIIQWKRAEKDCRMPFNIYFSFQMIVALEFNTCFYLVFPKKPFYLTNGTTEERDTHLLKVKWNEHRLDFLQWNLCNSMLRTKTGNFKPMAHLRFIIFLAWKQSLMYCFEPMLVVITLTWMCVCVR